MILKLKTDCKVDWDSCIHLKERVLNFQTFVMRTSVLVAIHKFRLPFLGPQLFRFKQDAMSGAFQFVNYKYHQSPLNETYFWPGFHGEIITNSTNFTNGTAQSHFKKVIWRHKHRDFDVNALVRKTYHWDRVLVKGVPGRYQWFFIQERTTKRVLTVKSETLVEVQKPHPTPVYGPYIVLYPFKGTFYEAKLFCQKNGGSMTDIESEELMGVLSEKLKALGMDSIWTGFTDKDSDGIFHFGSKPNYLNVSTFHGNLTQHLDLNNRITFLEQNCKFRGEKALAFSKHAFLFDQRMETLHYVSCTIPASCSPVMPSLLHFGKNVTRRTHLEGVECQACLWLMEKLDNTFNHLDIKGKLLSYCDILLKGEPKFSSLKRELCQTLSTSVAENINILQTVAPKMVCLFLELCKIYDSPFVSIDMTCSICNEVYGEITERIAVMLQASDGFCWALERILQSKVICKMMNKQGINGVEVARALVRQGFAFAGLEDICFK